MQHNQPSENIEIVGNICDYYHEDLRGYQIEALEFMNERNRGIIQCFCGTGKSRIIYEKTTQYNEGNVLLVFPSLALVQQFNNQYLDKQNNEKDAQIIICDSKHTKTINEETFSADLNIFLTTYQSLAKFKQYFDYFDLVIFDEAHHIATQRIINLIQLIKNADIFYFTTTPKIAKKLLNMYQSQDQQEESKDFVEDDNGQVQNPIDCGEIFVYDFNQALQDGYVTDYELHHCIYQPLNYIIEDQFNAMIKFAEIHKRTRIIAFNQFIDKETEKKTNSHAFTQFESELVQIQIVSAKTKPEARESIFKWFQEKDYGITKIIFNVSCVKEGIDLPCCDLIVFCDDKQSPIDIIQCIGRVTRISDNKQTAMITAMIPLDLEQASFKIVTNICKALKSVDFRMKNISNNKLPTDKIKLGKWIQHQRSDKKTGSLSEYRIQQLEKIPEQQWEVVRGKSTTQTHSHKQSIIKNTHQRAFISNTNTLFTRCKENPQELLDYHNQRDLKQKTYPVDQLPHTIIIEKIRQIKNKSKVQIIDLGCGMNKVAEGLKDDQRFEFTSIDFQKLPEAFGNVQQYNIADLSHIEEFTFKYAIMSLCFWGVDFEKSIQECFRILEDPGVLYIIQTKKKMEGFESILQNAGFTKKDEQVIGKYHYLEYRK